MSYSNFAGMAAPTPRQVFMSRTTPRPSTTSKPYNETVNPASTSTTQTPPVYSLPKPPDERVAAAPAAPGATVPTPPAAPAPAPATIQKPADIPTGSTQSVPPPGANTAPDPYDIRNDPGFLLGQSQGAGRRGGAAADYLASMEDSLLGYGSQSLAKKVLDGMAPELEKYMVAAGQLAPGAHLDLSPYYQSFYVHDANGNVVNDANGNPVEISDPNQGFSTLAQLGRQANQATANSVNANRLSNLMYSSAGAQRLGDTAYHNQAMLNNSANTEQGLLNQFLSNYHSGLGAAQDTENQAAQAAYDRATQRAIAFHTGDRTGTGDNSGGGGSNGGDGTPTGSGPGGTQSAVDKASAAALAAAQKAGKSPAAAALAARSAGLNALHGLGAFATLKKDTRPKTTAPRPTRVH